MDDFYIIMDDLNKSIVNINNAKILHHKVHIIHSMKDSTV